jgi:hypothetical protein
MASTYSNLKIELMATGENSGTWGNITNTNLGTALEEAIVGSADVTFSGSDVTLTLTNTNATQTARNLRLNLTGTSGGPRNLIVPAVEKLYVVQNGLVDTVTVKNSTGTGITLPAGKTSFVYNDGTNVVDVTTYLTSLTLGSALPASSGGTGLTSPGASGNVLVSDGTNWVSSTASGGFSSISVIGTNTNASAKVLYVFTANLTLTLPASPSVGDYVGISNLSGVTTCVIGRNGNNIMALAEDLTVDVVDAGFTLYYADSTRGWVIL